MLKADRTWVLGFLGMSVLTLVGCTLPRGPIDLEVLSPPNVVDDCNVEPGMTPRLHRSRLAQGPLGAPPHSKFHPVPTRPVFAPAGFSPLIALDSADHPILAPAEELQANPKTQILEPPASDLEDDSTAPEASEITLPQIDLPGVEAGADLPRRESEVRQASAEISIDLSEHVMPNAADRADEGAPLDPSSPRVIADPSPIPTGVWRAKRRN